MKESCGAIGCDYVWLEFKIVLFCSLFNWPAWAKGTADISRRHQWFPRETTVVYHLHEQTGRFTVWVNGNKNSRAFSIQPKIPGNFGRYIKWNEPFRFSPTGIFGTSFEGGPVWPVWSVRPKCPFLFDKIVVPSTALLYPAYRNNNQTRGGLCQVWATGIPFDWTREISEISNRNFGLMLRPGIAFTICTNQFHLPNNGQETA